MLGIVNSSNKAIEGDPFVVTCKPSGDPKLIIYWIKEDNNQRINGSILNFTSINRNDSGTYRCEVENDCASDSRVEVINVSCKYDEYLQTIVKVEKWSFFTKGMNDYITQRTKLVLKMSPFYIVVLSFLLPKWATSCVKTLGISALCRWKKRERCALC